MTPRSPIAELPTHSVTNMPPPIGDQDLWAGDAGLRHWAQVQGANWAQDRLASVGKAAGSMETFDLADLANRHVPELRAFDRYGMRIDQVAFHPAYHDLMRLAIEHEIPSFAWRHSGAGAQVAHAAMTYMFSQPEGGVMCPMAMTYAVIPSLRGTPAIADEWLPRLLSTEYDRRDIPAGEKTGATIGMFMTEKQGGSDVRSNSTTATPLGERTGKAAQYLLTGHKFFCSAPMCDAFLVLAHAPGGLSCFLVPRWKPDGRRNHLFIQRLKDKLGNRSNASSEMEFLDTHAVMVGDEGRGVRTIIDMVQGNRIYCAMASAGLMRQALVQALHHTRHRSAFQKRLIDQPLMQNVLADLAVETEAALALGLRVARAIDEGLAGDADAAAFARLGTAVAKYWNCKRAPYAVFEAMECLGGPGYIEDTILPRLYREAPVNSIWEGSGNVVCLDVLRAIGREPAALSALWAELDAARGTDARLDAAIDRLKEMLGQAGGLEAQARSITELMSQTLAGALLVQHGTVEVAEAYCASRLGTVFSGAFGTLPAGTDLAAIISRAAV